MASFSSNYERERGKCLHFSGVLRGHLIILSKTVKPGLTVTENMSAWHDDTRCDPFSMLIDQNLLPRPDQLKLDIFGPITFRNFNHILTIFDIFFTGITETLAPKFS